MNGNGSILRHLLHWQERQNYNGPQTGTERIHRTKGKGTRFP